MLTPFITVKQYNKDFPWQSEYLNLLAEKLSFPTFIKMCQIIYLWIYSIQISILAGFNSHALRLDVLKSGSNLFPWFCPSGLIFLLGLKKPEYYFYSSKTVISVLQAKIMVAIYYHSLVKKIFNHKAA